MDASTPHMRFTVISSDWQETTSMAGNHLSMAENHLDGRKPPAHGRKPPAPWQETTRSMAVDHPLMAGTTVFESCTYLLWDELSYVCGTWGKQLQHTQ